MIGKQILHYKITEKLGEGGMGVVFLAEDTRLERKVALKFLPRSITTDEAERERFRIEAKAAAALNHPNIATIHAIEETDDEMFIAMEYIEGRELREMINIPLNPPSKGDFPPSSPSKGGAVTSPLEGGLRGVLNIATQIAAGLQAAHEKGVIHRDIKSSNIMVTDKGQVKIMDFGLARVQGTAHVTRAGTTLGTAAYMSPEQFMGSEAGVQSDIWSLGVVFYEMTVGDIPFTGQYQQAIMYAITNEEPSPLPTPGDESSQLWHQIIYRCLKKELTERYQNLEELRQDIARLTAPASTAATAAAQGTAAVSKSAPTRKWSRVSRKQLLVLLAVVLIAALWASPLRKGIIHWVVSLSVPEQRHLLVLPFSNVGSDSSNQAFCDGLVETLTSKLTQLEQFQGSLWVVPASEVFGNNISSAAQARKIFGANLVVSGSLQRLDNTLRLSLNLVDAKNLRQINAALIDVGAEQLTTLQDRSVAKLLELLNLELNPPSQEMLQAGGTVHSGAYEAYLQGLGYLQRFENPANLRLAVGLFGEAIAQDSAYALAYAGRGQAYWRLYEASREKRWADKALEECEKAVNLNAALPEVNISLGIVHTGTGRYEESTQDFLRALNRDPLNASAHRGLARAYELTGKLGEAEKTYQKAIDLKPDFWAGYNDLGIFYFRHGQYDQAIEQFRRVVSLTPDNERGYNNLGGVYYLMKRWAEAREMFEKSLKIKKTYRVCSNLGTLYYIEGQYSRAARMYEMAVNLNDQDYRIWGNLAVAYFYAPGEKEKADKTYQQAIRLAEENRKVNPENADVLADLAGYYSMTDQQEKSYALIDTALKLDPDNLQVIYRVSTTLEQLGEREKAIFWMGRALQGGYSLEEVSHQPELRGMVADPRFQKLINEIKPGAHQP